MSDSELTLSEDSPKCEGSTLVTKQGKQKRAANTEKDDATLLSDESSGEDDADDLVLEYSDNFGGKSHGELLDDAEYTEGSSVTASEDEITGYTEDGEIYESESRDNKSGELIGHNGSHDSIKINGQVDEGHAKDKSPLTNDKISKIADVLSTHADVASTHLEEEITTQRPLAPPGRAVLITNNSNHGTVLNDSLSNHGTVLDDSLSRVKINYELGIKDKFSSSENSESEESAEDEIVVNGHSRENSQASRENSHPYVELEWDDTFNQSDNEHEHVDQSVISQRLMTFSDENEEICDNEEDYLKEGGNVAKEKKTSKCVLLNQTRTCNREKASDGSEVKACRVIEVSDDVTAETEEEAWSINKESGTRDILPQAEERKEERRHRQKKQKSKMREVNTKSHEEENETTKSHEEEETANSLSTNKPRQNSSSKEAQNALDKEAQNALDKEVQNALDKEAQNALDKESPNSLGKEAPLSKQPRQKPSSKEPPHKNKAANKKSRGSKKTRHKIYLDDPDIHQCIQDHATILRKFVDDVECGKFIKVAKNRLHPVSRDDISPAKTREKNRKYKSEQQLDSILDSIPDSLSDSNFGAPETKQLRQTKSLGYMGPYDGHGKRGRNIISRIKEDSESSTSEVEDDDEFTNRTINTKRRSKSASGRNHDEIYEECPDCGERHPPDDEEFMSDQEICPDCGVAHNPYQHPPAAKDPVEPPGDETLPSIEGPHTREEFAAEVNYKMKYLGSTQIVTQHPITKETRMQQAQEAYSRIKAPDEESQPSTCVDVRISLERIKVVNTEERLEDIMMDHSLRTICFICDMGNILVLMARRLTTETTDISFDQERALSLTNIIAEREKRISKNICHVFECEEAQKVAKAIGQAFNMAYRQFLKSNGISHDSVEEAEYCHVLESQKIVGQDLDKLTDTANARDVVVQKKRGEYVGVMLLESGWGSMLPTVFVAHIANYSPAARLGGQLSVGDHLLSCNGASLVGLPISECQQIIRNTRTSSRVIFRVVSCPPVVDVVVSRPDTKYQLGFSVQNGTICSLLRGGIAERGGVRVGHRIIEINGESVVAKSHQRIVDILASTIGAISMKTMPVAMYRLMVGTDQPHHV